MFDKVLVTGGAGFIGSALIRQFIEETDVTVINVDKLTYAGNLASLGPAVENSSYYAFERVDICDETELQRVFAEQQPDAVMHLAAESHVDRSIDGPSTFIETNIVGTYKVLQAARAYWSDLPAPRKESFRFHHISTDEVFGSLGAEGLFREETAYDPRSPYAASKAASDHLVRSWHTTYGLPVVLTNCSNNYGAYQFTEKLIPLVTLAAIAGKPLPIYGDGQNIRDWLYVDDHCRALRLVLENAKIGETYNIGGRNEKSNLEVVTAICSILDDVRPRPDGKSYSTQITFVPDRPGHDRRYAIDAGKLERELGWKPQETFESGLRKTVEWYLGNAAWCGDIKSGRYRGERLGLIQ
tara:strand:+ start:15572 stop:16636 length:1065 start_codon:yes stop_codon:yes gene_type:complete